MAIHILDANTIGKISAGEVVERPASVVKELMENSIDAGATSITVEIKDGGISYLRVTDNGCGIPFSQARMAFENHATSKLQNADGLWDIRTLGFRGEALPSIAAVSRVTMTTRTKDAEFGAKVEMEGGTFVSISETGCPEGTTIVMRDLFFNLPVRRNFLKKPSYEQNTLSEVVQKILLGNPHVSVRLISSGKTILKSPGDGDLRHAVLSVYGRECALNMKEIDAGEGSLTIRGLIGVGDQAKATRAQQCFFINGRLIRCQMLSQALEEVCRGRVTIGMYPMCALSVTVPPEAVDINVHPSKMEVRFRDEAAFRISAQSILSKAFGGESMTDAFTAPRSPEPVQNIVERIATVSEKTAAAEPAKQAEVQSKSQPETPPPVPTVPPVRLDGMLHEGGTIPKGTPPVEGIQAVIYGPVVQPPVAKTGKASDTAKDTAPVEEKPARPAYVPEKVEQTVMNESVVAPKETQYRLIGVLFNTYILLECEDNFIMIDQHAAHERLNFEDYKRRLDDGSAAQQLLVPYIVHVSRREADILNENRALLLDAGYEIEPFGDTDIQVRSVPFVMGQSDMRLLFTELIDSLDTLKSAEREKRITGIMQASCKHAVKAGDKLSDAEIHALLDAMIASDAPPTCPHGRPVMRVMSKREIEHYFKRIQ